MSSIHVPEPLRERLGPEGAQALVELINGAGERIRGDVFLLAEERFSSRLGESIAALETRLTERMAALETRLTERMAALETRLTDKMAALETRGVRWAFVFWVGQLAVLLTILFAFFRR